MVDVRRNLRRLTGLSYRQIADMLGVSPATIYQRTTPAHWRVSMIEQAADTFRIAPERIIDTDRFDAIYHPDIDLMQFVAGNLRRVAVGADPVSVGVSKRSLAYWKKGIGNPTVAELERLAWLYRIKIADLFKVKI